MLDATEFFECRCYTDEHTIKFTLDESPDDLALFVTVYLGTNRGFWGRLWYGLRYAFGYQSRYGAFYCWLMRAEDGARLKALVDRFMQAADAASGCTTVGDDLVRKTVGCNGDRETADE